MNRLSHSVIMVLLSSVSTVAAQPAPPPPKPLLWLTSREVGLRDAQANKRPILVRFGGEACPWCRRLDEEIAKPAVQAGLQRWTLVELDVEKAVADARKMNVESIPALRILSSTGRMLESHDGFLTEEKLLAWLDKSFDRATAAPDEVLLSTGAPAPVELQRIIRQFADRDPTAREAAIRRLLPYPAEAAEAVIVAMRQEKLGIRLVALELLREWHAPLDDLDPWRPETMTAERMGRFDEWLAKISTKGATPWSLTPAALTDARADIDQMLKADLVTAAAIRDRLARHKGALLPAIVARLKESVSDEERSRLLALRYRLAMDDSIALRSPGLVERLAAVDVRTRHLAVQELTEQAGPETQPLFLELFADADPLVRELSLLGLRTAGGAEGTNALVKLLDDPEPNVRAAVLKQLAENPWPELQPRLAEFLKTEKETALLVHAVRCFRKLKTKTPGVLLPLLEHAEWQVRAETLDTLTGAWQRYPESETRELLKNEAVRNGIVARLGDDDAFVVSRAMLGVKSEITLAVVKKLLEVPEKHPSLMKEVVSVLSTASNLKSNVLPSLKTFFASRDPAVRAAAIQGMGSLAPAEIPTQILSALQDEESEVRVAGASTLLGILARAQPRLNNGRWTFPNSSSPAADDDDVMEAAPAVPVPAAAPAPPSSTSLLGGIVRGLFGGAPPPQAPRAVPAVSAADDEKAKAEQPGRALELAQERDKWLTEFHEGKHRPQGFDGMMIAPLQKMFASASTAERIASAAPLVAVGQGEDVLPQIVELAVNGGKDGADVLDAMQWLPFDERQKLAGQIVKLPNARDFAGKLLSVLSQGHDIRDVDIMWSLCDVPHAEPDALPGIQYGLRPLYFGERYWDTSSITPARKKRVYDTVSTQLDSPRGWRHLLALVLLHESLPEDPEEGIAKIQAAAQALIDDESLTKELRADAFQLLLFTRDKEAQTGELQKLLQTGSPSQQILALRTLTHDGVGLGNLVNSHLSLTERNPVSRATKRGEEIHPEPPAGLTTEMVRPFLASSDAEARALAGYVLAVSEEPGGLAPLIEYWRLHVKGRDDWDRLVYRAIAATNDSSQMPVLKQIYKQLDQWQVNEFYWTIRGMTGPKALEFRKQIRDEKGADALR